MSGAVAESPAWTRRRWWLVVGALVAAHFTLIFWLGDSTPLMMRQARNEPRVALVPSFGGEVAELENPTLFAWPNPRGFSALAWLQVPPVEYRAADWTEPPRYLGLSTVQLGDIVRHVVQSNASPVFEATAKSELAIALPELASRTTSLPTQSMLRVESGLEGRRLLSNFELPPWRHGDLLTNSVVQILVDADGRPQSATLLSGSGRAEADRLALDLARGARFESLRGAGPDRLKDRGPEFTWGTLIFAWHTLPLQATNSPAAAP